MTLRTRWRKTRPLRRTALRLTFRIRLGIIIFIFVSFRKLPRAIFLSLAFTFGSPGYECLVVLLISKSRILTKVSGIVAVLRVFR